MTNPDREVRATMDPSSPRPAALAALASSAIIAAWLYLALRFGPAVAVVLLLAAPAGALLAGWGRRTVLDAAERRRSRPAWLVRGTGRPRGQHRPEEVALRLALVGLTPGMA